MRKLKVGIIGYGLRARGVFTLLYGLNKNASVELAAVCDPRDIGELKDEIKKENISFDNTRFYIDADAMLDTEELDGVIIGTRCSLHTVLAVKVMKRGIPLFLEKPVATSFEDWNTLKAAYEESRCQVVVSFPLRLTPLVREAKEIILKNDIGPIQHVAAFNYVTYGGDYYHEWYRDENETGGLFLQKATHDFDYINYILDANPIEVCAMSSKQIMKGNKPAGLKCEDCDERFTCKEGPFQIVNTTGDFVHGPYCCFAEDTGNEDSGSAIVRYENGMHMVYTQNFFVRNKHAGKRGAIFAGEGGTVEFDWHTSDIYIRRNYIPGEMKYHVETAGRHGGGDLMLVQNFLDVMLGDDVSRTPLEEGLLSAYMCLKARESAKSGRFAEIDYKIR